MGRRFDGQVVLVTGAASGIGRAVALGFGREGAQVVACDREPNGLNETVRSILDAGGRAIGHEADVSQGDSVAALFGRIEADQGRLDVAANCAGVTGPVALLADVEEADFDRCLGVNLKGVWLCMRAELRLMLPRGAGAIVNIASVAGLSGSKRASPYVASKHGVVGLTKAAALEYSGCGLRINAVCPGATETAQTAPILARPQAREAMLRHVPMGRFAAPEEIAAAVLWLASEEASFATGAAFVLDGGMSA